jgi:hypothetical protein
VPPECYRYGRRKWVGFAIAVRWYHTPRDQRPKHGHTSLLICTPERCLGLHLLDLNEIFVAKKGIDRLGIAWSRIARLLASASRLLEAATICTGIHHRSVFDSR